MAQDSTTATPLIDVQFALAQDLQLLAHFVAHLIFPALTVGEKSGKIPRWLRRARIENVKRAKDGSFQRVESAIDDITYVCEESALEERVPDEDRKHFRNRHFDVVLKAARAVVRSLLIAREDAVASTLFSTGTFGSGYNTAGAGAWGHASASDPIKDVELAKEEVRKRIGVYPNHLVIGAGLWTKASYDPKILAQVKTLRAYAGDITASRGRISLNVLADVFGVEQVLVGMGVKDTAKEGQASVMSDIWNATNALVFYRDTSDVDNVGLGRMINWLDDELISDLSDAEELEDNPLVGFLVDRYREEKTASDIVRVREYNQFKLVNKDAGHLITTI